MKRLNLVPSDGGRFEVTVDGRQIWSKKQSKSFPETHQILEELGD
ncbi:MAG: Rdx family protein [Actinomycetota bacterium]